MLYLKTFLLNAKVTCSSNYLFHLFHENDRISRNLFSVALMTMYSEKHSIPCFFEHGKKWLGNNALFTFLLLCNNIFANIVFPPRNDLVKRWYVVQYEICMLFWIKLEKDTLLVFCRVFCVIVYNRRLELSWSSLFYHLVLRLTNFGTFQKFLILWFLSKRRKSKKGTFSMINNVNLSSIFA